MLLKHSVVKNFHPSAKNVLLFDGENVISCKEYSNFRERVDTEYLSSRSDGAISSNYFRSEYFVSIHC